MISFKEYLEEGYKNLFTDSQKRKYAEEAYAQLQKSYEEILVVSYIRKLLSGHRESKSDKTKGAQGSLFLWFIGKCSFHEIKKYSAPSLPSEPASS